MRGFPTAPMPYPPTWHRDHYMHDDVPAHELDEAAGYDVPDPDPIDRLTEDNPTEAEADTRSAA